VTEGSGLGLAIVDQIVRQSGAALQLRSPLESGPGFSASIRFDPDHMFE
jgi:two-component system OmpR family sensor kinase